MRRNRIYQTKGPEALHARLDITVTEALKQQVVDAALKADMPVTEFVRNMIVAGMELDGVA